jgi:hypothetical protein
VGGLEPAVAVGGELVLSSTAAAPITCSVDGYTTETGSPVTVQFKINPGERLNIPPSLSSPSKSIDWVDCGNGLRTRAMHLTLAGPDATLYLNGQQRRTLNANLYSSIPTDPTLGYTPLLRGLTLLYQAKHPDVLLNLVLNTGIDTYDFAGLKGSVFGPEGFDVVEIDTVFLRFLVHNDLITESTITGDEPWPVAKEAATVEQT